MIRNIKIYCSFLGASIKKMIEYRADCLIGVFSQIAFQVIELIFIWIIFQNTESIAGWTFEHLLLFYGVMLFSISVVDLLFDSTYELGRIYIRKGKFDTILLRPVHPLISILRRYSWIYIIRLYYTFSHIDNIYAYKTSSNRYNLVNFKNSIFWNFRWNYNGRNSDYI